jgi:hypothetical protein
MKGVVSNSNEEESPLTNNTAEQTVPWVLTFSLSKLKEGVRIIDAKNESFDARFL